MFVIGFALVFFSTTAPAPAVADDAPSVADIVQMLDEVPAREIGPLSDRPGNYGHTKDGARIAQGIHEAVLTGTLPGYTTPQLAALMAVTAAFESGAHVTTNIGHQCIHGDSGASWGPFQLKGVPKEAACDPVKAAKAWLAKANSTLCLDNDPAEQLAAMASGRCDAARLKVRRRDRLAREIGDMPID